MDISENGLQLIKRFEGFSSRPYWDPYGRVWTRGYGETEGITGASPATSPKAAQKRLQQLVESRYEPAIRALGVEFTQNQWDALCSFVWNLGPGILVGDLRAALERHEWVRATNLMLAYDHANGQLLAGLEIRRREEVALFLTPKPPYVPADEARWEHEYDNVAHKKTTWASLRRRVLQRTMRARIIEISKNAQHNGWNTLNRADRYRKLIARI